MIRIIAGMRSRQHFGSQTGLMAEASQSGDLKSSNDSCRWGPVDPKLTEVVNPVRVLDEFCFAGIPSLAYDSAPSRDSCAQIAPGGNA